MCRYYSLSAHLFCNWRIGMFTYMKHLDMQRTAERGQFMFVCIFLVLHLLYICILCSLVILCYIMCCTRLHSNVYKLYRGITIKTHINPHNHIFGVITKFPNKNRTWWMWFYSLGFNWMFLCNEWESSWGFVTCFGEVKLGRGTWMVE